MCLSINTWTTIKTWTVVVIIRSKEWSSIYSISCWYKYAQLKTLQSTMILRRNAFSIGWTTLMLCGIAKKKGFDRRFNKTVNNKIAGSYLKYRPTLRGKESAKMGKLLKKGEKATNITRENHDQDRKDKTKQMDCKVHLLYRKLQ